MHSTDERDRELAGFGLHAPKTRRSGKNRSRAPLLTTWTANSPASTMSHPSVMGRRRFCARGNGGSTLSSYTCAAQSAAGTDHREQAAAAGTHGFAHDARDRLDRAPALGALFDLGDDDPAPEPRDLAADALARVCAPALPAAARRGVGQRRAWIRRHGPAHAQELGLEVRRGEELGVQRGDGVRGWEVGGERLDVGQRARWEMGEGGRY